MNNYILNQYLDSLEKYFFNSSDNIVILEKSHQDSMFNNYIMIRREYEKSGLEAPIDVVKSGWRYNLSPVQKKDKVILSRISI